MMEAYISELEAKLNLLERFVRSLVIFGVDSSLLAKAEEAMWAEDISGSVSGSSTVQTRLSSCDFAVDSTGHKIRISKGVGTLSQQQLEAVLSLEKICQRFSGSDLGSLEESFNSLPAASSHEISDSRPSTCTPSLISIPTTSLTARVALSDIVSAAPVADTTSMDTPTAGKTFIIRAPLSQDISPRKRQAPSIRKPISQLKPKLRTADPHHYPANARDSSTRSMDLSSSQDPMNPDIALAPSSRCSIRRKCAPVKPPPPSSKEAAISKLPVSTTIATKRAVPNAAQKQPTSLDPTLSNGMSSNHTTQPSLRRRPSLYQPTLSSSLKSSTPPKLASGGMAKKVNRKRNSILNIF